MSHQDAVLLPPSCFESHSTVSAIVDPWKALAQATGDILDLQQLNTRLKESKLITIQAGEEIKARVDLHQHRSPPVQSASVDLTHYHDIITRQAGETSKLSEKLAQMTAGYEKHLGQLESQLLLKDTQYSQQLHLLEEKLLLMSQQYQTEKVKLEGAMARCEEDHMTAINQWQQELETTKYSYSNQLTNLECKINKLEQQRVAMETDIKDKTSNYEEKIENQTRTISQLKTYLTDNENKSKSTEIWRKDQENLKQKLEMKEAERSKMESNLNLLNIRLKSQNDLLIIQEKELSKVKDCSLEKRKQCLLTRWREKVFELLVQLKCSEISHEDQRRGWNNQTCKLQNELDTVRTQCDQLQCLVQDKQAQIDIHANNNQALEAELTHTQQVAIMLDDQQRSDQAALNQLIQFVHGLRSALEESEARYSQVITTISSHNQRLSYASGRVQVLQGQFERREAHIKLEMMESLKEHPTRDTGGDNDPSLINESDIRTELARVTEERDLLASQIKSDARMLEKKVLNARQQVSDDMELLQGRVAELHTELEERNKAVEASKEAISGLGQEVEEYKESIDTLKSQLAQFDSKATHDKESACTALETQYIEQLAAMEHKMNDVRREHTKAVVSLRQLERQITREKQRQSEHVTRLENQYKQQLVLVENKLRVADKDRNLLMATLRQEGLINKYKSERPMPAVPTDIIENIGGFAGQSTGFGTEEQSPLATYQTRTGELSSVGQDTWPQATQVSGNETDDALHTVIDDVKLLAQAVLQDSDSDS